MFFMISSTAVKTIAKVSNNITSVIQIHTPFHKGAETAAAVPLQHILYHNANNMSNRIIYRGFGFYCRKIRL